MGYKIVEETPEPSVYCDIREKCGLSYRSLESASAALPRSIYGISLVDEDQRIIGMGRIIGDEFCFMYVVDICVLPEHQKKGLGKVIVKKLTDYIDANATKDCDVILIAIGKARFLYEKCGFFSTAEFDSPPSGSISMRYRRPTIGI